MRRSTSTSKVTSVQENVAATVALVRTVIKDFPNLKGEGSDVSPEVQAVRKRVEARIDFLRANRNDPAALRGYAYSDQIDRAIIFSLLLLQGVDQYTATLLQRIKFEEDNNLTKSGALMLDILDAGKLQPSAAGEGQASKARATGSPLHEAKAAAVVVAPENEPVAQRSWSGFGHDKY
jgi:hypothetical protein